MSEVALETFITFRRKERKDGFVFYPAPRQYIPGTNDKPGVVVLGDIPLPAGVPHPTNGLTLLYGFRDMLDENQSQRLVAKREGMTFFGISMTMPVNSIIMGMLTRKKLPRTKFVNLKRLAKDLQVHVLDTVNEMAVAEDKRHKPFTNIVEAGARPDLVCKVLQQPPFEHITVAVYPVPNGTARGRQVATIFSTKVKDFSADRRQVDPLPFKVELPDFG